MMHQPIRRTHSRNPSATIQPIDIDDDLTVDLPHQAYMTTSSFASQLPKPDFSSFYQQNNIPYQHLAPQQVKPQPAAPHHTITLNVGGTQYSTTLSTLLRINDTYFTARFSNPQRQLTAFNPLEIQFIDRCGILFHYILNYLRDPQLQWLEHCTDMVMLQQLYSEAQYYCLMELAQHIKQRIDTNISQQLESQYEQQQQQKQLIHALTPQKHTYQHNQMPIKDGVSFQYQSVGSRRQLFAGVEDDSRSMTSIDYESSLSSSGFSESSLSMMSEHSLTSQHSMPATEQRPVALRQPFVFSMNEQF